MLTSLFSFSVSLNSGMLWYLAAAVTAYAIVMTAILFYHWFRYGNRRHTANIAALVYGAGLIILLIVLWGSLARFLTTV